MNRRERKKLYKQTIQKWGIASQLGMLMEECAELIQATHKVIRLGEKKESVWQGLVEEMADVEIMLEQIQTAIDWENLEKRVATAKHDKLLRLKKRLEVTSDKQE